MTSTGDDVDEPEYIFIDWTLSIGLVGCKRTGTIKVEADCTDDEIEEYTRDVVMEEVERTWKRRP